MTWDPAHGSLLNQRKLSVNTLRHFYFLLRGIRPYISGCCHRFPVWRILSSVSIRKCFYWDQKDKWKAWPSHLGREQFLAASSSGHAGARSAEANADLSSAPRAPAWVTGPQSLDLDPQFSPKPQGSPSSVWRGQRWKHYWLTVGLSERVGS